MPDSREHDDMIADESKPGGDENQPENEYDYGEIEDDAPAFGGDIEVPGGEAPTGESDEQAAEGESEEDGDSSSEEVDSQESVVYDPELLSRARNLGFSDGDVRAIGDPDRARAMVAEIELKQLKEGGLHPKKEEAEEEQEAYAPQLDDNYDDDVKAEFGRLNEYHDKRYSKLEEKFNEITSKFDDDDKRRLSEERNAALGAFDGRIGKLEREDLFGKGRTEREIRPGVKGYKNRQKLASLATAIINSESSLGNTIGEDDAYAQAFRTLFSGDPKEEAVGDVAKTLKRNAGQVLSRPTGRKSKETVSGTQKAQGRVNKFLSSHGIFAGDGEGAEDELF